MTLRKRAADEQPDFDAQAAKRQNNNPGSPLTITDPRLPSLRWLFEQSQSSEAYCNTRLPSLGEDISRSVTPLGRHDASRSIPRTPVRQKDVVAARGAAFRTDDHLCYGMVRSLGLKMHNHTYKA